MIFHVLLTAYGVLILASLRSPFIFSFLIAAFFLIFHSTLWHTARGAFWIKEKALTYCFARKGMELDGAY